MVLETIVLTITLSKQNPFYREGIRKLYIEMWSGFAPDMSTWDTTTNGALGSGRVYLFRHTFCNNPADAGLEAGRQQW